MNTITKGILRNIGKKYPKMQEYSKIKEAMIDIDPATRQWNMKTVREWAIWTIEEIWNNRYFIDWDNLNLLSRITPSVLMSEEYGDLQYFIHWGYWTRVQAHNIDSDFFRKFYRDMDILYVFMHRDKFTKLEEEDLRIASDLFVVRRTNHSRPLYYWTTRDEVTIGIPDTYRKSMRIWYGRQQLEKLADLEEKKKAEKAADEAKKALDDIIRPAKKPGFVTMEELERICSSDSDTDEAKAV